MTSESIQRLIPDFPSYGNDQALSSCRKNIFAFISLFFLIILIYSNNFNASWHFDDEPNILFGDALHLKRLNWTEIKETFFWGHKIYRPVACLSIALNYYFGQDNVFGYHLINNLIHVISAFFLFLFISCFTTIVIVPFDKPDIKTARKL